jgi:hypothetical protein
LPRGKRTALVDCSCRKIGRNNAGGWPRHPCQPTGKTAPSTGNLEYLALFEVTFRIEMLE